jgi:hypothetical protein
MLASRTAWAIALLLAPAGVAAAATGTIKAPAQHTAYVEITVTDDQTSEAIAPVEVRLACVDPGTMDRALAWLSDREACQTPPGATVYVTRAQAPDPGEHALLPTGTVYAYEDEDRVWTVREYRYAAEDRDWHAYALTRDLADRVDDEAPGEPVRGVVDLEQMGVEPGERVDLSTTLGPAPTTTPTDPNVQRVGAGGGLPDEALGVTG